MIGWPVLLAYFTLVPGICSNLGPPSYCASNLASSRLIAEVCGMSMSSRASSASSVPATDERTPPRSDPGAMSLKACGSWSA